MDDPRIKHLTVADREVSLSPAAYILKAAAEVPASAPEQGTQCKCSSQGNVCNDMPRVAELPSCGPDRTLRAVNNLILTPGPHLLCVK